MANNVHQASQTMSNRCSGCRSCDTPGSVYDFVEVCACEGEYTGSKSLLALIAYRIDYNSKGVTD